MKGIILIFIFLSTQLLFAQTIQPLGDIYPGTSSSLFSSYNSVIEFNGNLLFSADDGIHGVEIWIYDGTKTQLLKDINIGNKGSYCEYFYQLNGKVIFIADDGIHGTEFWITDGTTEGTFLMMDFQEGSNNGIFPPASFTDKSACFFLDENQLYFNGSKEEDNFELWKTDGTIEGTVLVKNIGEDLIFGSFAMYDSSFPVEFAKHKNEIYFSTRYDGLWKTDGTPSGTKQILASKPGSWSNFNPEDLYSMGEYLLMFEGNSLWRSDGTTEGTIEIKNLGKTHTLSANTGNRIARIEDYAYMAGFDEEHGTELWKSDGTPEGTLLVIDLYPGEIGYPPEYLTTFKNKIYFKGQDKEHGVEFFSTDGSAEGTKLVKDITPNGSSITLPAYFKTDGTLMYLSFGDHWQRELWISDGTTDGTYKIQINPNGESRPASIYKFGNQLFLFASTNKTGHEPYLISLDNDSDGYTADVDCDDDNPEINPGVLEINYNGVDDDCNPETFDDDIDQDGFMLTEDCDDNNSEINPTQTEIIYNGLDDDCNPKTFDDDIDQDGYTLTEDCDDNNAKINPKQKEIIYNGVDDDCDLETLDDDIDQDGFILAEDCNDYDFAINPSQIEIIYNGLDDDCNSETLDDDIDQDGFILAEDCNDNNSEINSNQTEIIYNGLDDDCNSETLDDDIDQDGFILAEDCNDNNSEINPTAEEIPNNEIDENCDGVYIETSIKNINNNIRISPNPSTRFINVEYDNSLVLRCSIYNISGKLIIRKFIHHTIDFKDFENGIYILKFEDENNNLLFSEKVIINR